MALFRFILTHLNQQSGNTFTIAGYREGVDEDAVFDLVNAFQTALVAAQAKYIIPLQVEVINEAGGESGIVYPTARFTDKLGALNENPIPDAEAAMWQGFGGVTRKGRSDWLFHGIGPSLLVRGQFIDTTAAPWDTLTDAAADLLWQARFAESPKKHYPIVAPPQEFSSWRFKSQLYLRRVGRPFSSSGQMHRYPGSRAAL